MSSATCRSPGKVILTTFAGRRDRMEVLSWYVNAAMARGIIDEWHVWDFSRAPEDTAWLRARFPKLRMTPGGGEAYFRAESDIHFSSQPMRLQFAVSASSDVHIGLRRVSGVGDSYEIVLGGWRNQGCVIRRFPHAEMVTDIARRGGFDTPVASRATPHVLPEYRMTDIAVEITATHLRASVAGKVVVDYDAPVAPGQFEVLYRSGFGCNAEWRFAETAGNGAYLYLSHLPWNLPLGLLIPRYIAFYQHYARNTATYGEDVILKCDDDVVFMDLDRLQDFIDFRRRHRGHFFVSANVVNNGVCAYVQQQDGVFPRDLIDVEMPDHGFQGSLWSSPAKAAALHRYFLANTGAFRRHARAPHEWVDRLSINFIAMLGADFAHVSDVIFDDEEYLSYQALWRSHKTNAIYWPFVVSHLSFGPQDAGLPAAELLAGYAELAGNMGVRPK